MTSTLSPSHACVPFAMPKHDLHDQQTMIGWDLCPSLCNALLLVTISVMSKCVRDDRSVEGVSERATLFIRLSSLCWAVTTLGECATA